VNTRLKIVTSVGVFSAALVGLMPACGSSNNGGNQGRLLNDGGPPSSGGASNGTGGAPATGNAGAGVGVGGAAGNGTVTTTPIGQTCLKDSDCGTQGLTCLLPTGTEFLGGGVANGVCTLDCSADINAVSPSAVSACAKVDPSATCLQVSPTQGFCWELCTTGAVPSSEIKCHNRRDMGCYDPDMVGTGYCKPTCRGDFDCAGRKCDLSEGICVDSIPAGRNLPLGSMCDPQLNDDPCQGRCIGISANDSGPLASQGFCSGLCKIGEIACGVDPTSKNPIAADCLFAPDMNADLGDLGFCAQLCDCNADCKNPDFICSSLPSQLVSQIGRKGACNPKAGANPGEANGIACTGTTKPPVVVDSGKPKPRTADAGPDAR
jgi:hypothetical protein